MYILILLITVISTTSPGPTKFPVLIDRQPDARTWTVDSPEEAAILCYKHQKKADRDGMTIKCQLFVFDVEKMTVKETKIPDLSFDDIKRIENRPEKKTRDKGV